MAAPPRTAHRFFRAGEHENKSSKENQRMELGVLGEMDIRGIVDYPGDGAGGDVVREHQVEGGLGASHLVRDTFGCRTQADAIGDTEIILSTVKNSVLLIGGIAQIALGGIAIGVVNATAFPVWQARAAVAADPRYQLQRAPS
jgi:hypothetical protein